ncbi:MAG TPA: SigE family RNA polymerase sigma factor [Candidatus Limnocylindrales bacterium]
MKTARRSPPRARQPGFAECYRNSYGRLAAQLNAYLGDAAAAEDVVQEAFLRAWQRWKQISGYEDPVAWVRRVAWNLATSRWRRIVREARLARHHRGVDVVEATGPENVALVAALRKLRPDHRRVIVLHYLADMSVAAIAAELNTPRGTVLSWLHRGRADLAVQLGSPKEGENA